MIEQHFPSKRAAATAALPAPSIAPTALESYQAKCREITVEEYLRRADMVKNLLS